MKRNLARLMGYVDGRIVTATIVVVLAVLLAGGVEDKRSCERQSVVRGALRDYAIAAANARDQSANREQARDPAQASTDRQAAAKFRAAARRVPELDCSTIPAGK